MLNVQKKYLYKSLHLATRFNSDLNFKKARRSVGEARRVFVMSLLDYINVDICIYEIKHDDLRYSILEFVSPVKFFNFKTSSYESIELDEKNYIQIIKLAGTSRPMYGRGYFFQKEKRSIIRSRNEFLFFELNPEEVESKLTLLLHTPHGYYLVKPKISKKKFIGLMKLHQMLQTWRHNSLKNLLTIEKDEERGEEYIEEEIISEKIKLLQIIYLVSLIVDSGFKCEWDEVQLSTESNFACKVKHFELLGLAYDCLDFLCGFSDLFKQFTKKKLLPLKEPSNSNEERLTMIEMFLDSCLQNQIPKAVSKLNFERKSFFDFFLNYQNFLNEEKFPRVNEATEENESTLSPSSWQKISEHFSGILNDGKMRKYEVEFKEKEKTRFLEARNSIKDKLENFTIEEIYDHRCALSLESLLEELRDDSLPDIFKLGKMPFLRYFPFSGIPILASVNEASQKDPWKLEAELVDKNWKVYGRIGQPELNNTQSVFDKYFNKPSSSNIVEVGSESNKISFNGIIPIFSSKVIAIIKPILYTEVFESTCMYLIFGNPFFSNKDAHLAGLVWLYLIILISEIKKRSSHGQDLINSIFASASIYINSTDHVAYFKKLIESPELALKGRRSYYCDDSEKKKQLEIEEEEKKEWNEICSENLAKPLFFISYYIKYYKKEIGEEKLIEIIGLMIREFIHRLVSGLLIKTNNLNKVKKFLFLKNSDFALFDKVDSPDNEHYPKTVKAESVKMLEKFEKEHPHLKNNLKYPSVRIALQEYCQKYVHDEKKNYRVNSFFLFTGVEKQTIGDFNLLNLKEIALDELNLPREKVEQLFEEENLFRYTHQSCWGNETFSQGMKTYYNESQKQVANDMKTILTLDLLNTAIGDSSTAAASEAREAEDELWQ